MAHKIECSIRQRFQPSLKGLTIGAHRGESGLGPEATAPVYRAAAKLAKTLPGLLLEGDVQRTKDGHLVMFHDGNAKRTTNVEKIFPDRADCDLGKFTLAELKSLDAGSWFNEAHPDEAREEYENLRIITFDEYLDIADEQNIGIYFETKRPGRYPGIEAQILAKLRQRGWVDENNTPVEGKEVRWQSFSADSLELAQQLAPEIPRTFLVGAQRWGKVLEIAEQVDASVVAPRSQVSFPWRIRRAHREGREVHPYTIDRKWQMRLHLFLGVDGFFTNRGDVAAEVLTGRKISRDDLFEEKKKKSA